MDVRPLRGSLVIKSRVHIGSRAQRDGFSKLLPTAVTFSGKLRLRCLGAIIGGMKTRTKFSVDTNPMRGLPPVHRLVASAGVNDLVRRVPAAVVADAARRVLEEARNALAVAQGTGAISMPTEQELAERVTLEALRRNTPTLQRVVNATGVVLHTGLGRARLADAARDALLEVATHHAAVEIDRETGRRGSRSDHVRWLLRELSGAEDATVVNNCAGAVFLAVITLAAQREVIISRGELVEIGGAFRMPDIIRAGGATLVEIGTTNRTRLSDYSAAITERTGLILRCRPSNFAIIGYTEDVPASDLVKLGHDHGIPVMDDQGSGAFLDLTGRNNTLASAVASGADLITASGDKLMGGPQAGLILGAKEYVDRISRHPLARALRVDKFTLAALEATLRLYRDPKKAMATIPTLRYLARGEPELRRMAQRLHAVLRAVLPQNRFGITLVAEHSAIGGGSLPGEELATVCVAICSLRDGPTAEEIARRFRQHYPAVFTRIRGDAVLLDPRTLEADEFATIADAAREVAA